MTTIETITIENIRGIESLEIKPGALTVISGSNGQGKSSVLAAIQAVFEGGHDASLIRKGEAKGVIEMTLADGTQIKRTITQKASTLDVKTKDGDKKSSPAKYLEQLAGGYGLDPIALLSAKPKDRAAFLLDHMRLTFQPDEVQEAVGNTWPIHDACDLEGLGKIRKMIYDQRTKANGAAKQAGESASALAATVNKEAMEGDWEAKSIELSSTLLDRSNELSSIEADARAAWQEQHRAIASEYEVKIRALEVECGAAIEKARDKWHADKAAAVAELSKEVAELSAEASRATSLAQQQRRAKDLLEIVEKQRKEYKTQDEYADRLTKAMERLDALKAKRMSSIGVDGVEIVEGDIHVNGLPFDALNTAQRYQLAFQLASVGVGKLPLMICDQAEVFDEANWKEFCEVAASSGLQIIAARVDDGPLSVEVAA